MGPGVWPRVEVSMNLDAGVIGCITERVHGITSYIYIYNLTHHIVLNFIYAIYSLECLGVIVNPMLDIQLQIISYK